MAGAGRFVLVHSEMKRGKLFERGCPTRIPTINRLGRNLSEHQLQRYSCPFESTPAKLRRINEDTLLALAPSYCASLCDTPLHTIRAATNYSRNPCFPMAQCDIQSRHGSSWYAARFHTILRPQAFGPHVQFLSLCS